MRGRVGATLARPMFASPKSEADLVLVRVRVIGFGLGFRLRLGQGLRLGLGQQGGPGGGEADDRLEGEYLGHKRGDVLREVRT